MSKKLISLIVVFSFLFTLCGKGYLLAISSHKNYFLRPPAETKVVPEKRITKNAKDLTILFVHPRLPNWEMPPTRPPAGLMSMAACLRDKIFIKTLFERNNQDQFIFPDISNYPNFKIKILDLQGETKDFDFEDYLVKIKPDIVAITASTPLIDEAQKLGRLTERSSPKSLRIIGGIHQSALPEETMEKGSFQAGVIGEGEETMVEIATRLAFGFTDLSSVAGIIVRTKKGKIEKNVQRKLVMKPDEYPFLSKANDLLKLQNYEKLEGGIPCMLFTSRGCFGRCIFCSSRTVFPGKKIYHIRSAQNIFEEIKYNYDTYEIKDYYVIDDVFTFQKNRVLELAGLIQSSGLKISIGIMSRVDFIDEDVANALEQIGCIIVKLGVESGDQELLDTVIDKKIKLDQVQQATQIIKKHNMHVKYYMMVGLPNQTWTSVKKSIKFVLENDPDSIDVSIAIPYPGSKLFADNRINFRPEIGKNYSKFTHDVEPQFKGKKFPLAVTQTNVMNADEISKAQYLFMQIFIHRKDKKKLAILMEELDSYCKEGKKLKIPKTEKRKLFNNFSSIISSL